MNQRPEVSCDLAVWRPHTKTLLVFLLAAFGSAAYPSLAQAITFADDFNRADSPIVPVAKALNCPILNAFSLVAHGGYR